MSFRRTTSMQIRLRNGKLALTDGAVVVVPGGTAGTGVTLNEPAVDMTVRQRVGASLPVTLTGSCTGNPSRIEYRLVDWYTLAPRTGWLTLIDNPAASWSQQIIYPQGGFDYVEIRDAYDTSLTSKSLNRFAVGEIVLCIGQSNMVLSRTAGGIIYPNGGKTSIEYAPSPTILRTRIGNYKDAFAANTPFATYGAGYTTTQTNADGWVYLANNLAIGLGVPVMLVNRGVSGSKIATWMAGQSSWSGTNAASPTMTALGNDWGTTIWLQGESNAVDTDTATQAASIRTVKAQCLAQNGRNNSTHTFVVVSLGPGNYIGSVEGQFGNMRAAQVDVSTDAGCLFGAAAHTGVNGVDSVHWDAATHSRVWRQVAANIVWKKTGAGFCTSGPKISGAVRTGTQLKIVITHAGGTSLMDGAGGTAGTALTGFEYKIAGTPVAYTSAITGPAEITLTLASAGAGTLSYGMMNSPHNALTPNGEPSRNALVLASIPCDNATYFNSGAIGCVMQPCAPFNVT